MKTTATSSSCWLAENAATWPDLADSTRLQWAAQRTKARLEALGMVWDVLAAQWEEGYRRLAAYAEERGDCNVAATAT